MLKYFFQNPLVSKQFTKTFSLQCKRFNQIQAKHVSKSKYSFFKTSLWGITGGTLLGIGYSFYTNYKLNKIPTSGLLLENTALILNDLPDIIPTREIVGSYNGNLDLIVFQYQTCPFCSKVRAFMDYNGFSYKVVEVDAVLRQSLKWSNYKKVPTVLIKTNKGYRQLNDSTAIISILSSFMISQYHDIDEIIDLYPSSRTNDDGKIKDEILNKYFVMYQSIPTDKSIKELEEERHWRKWADNTLVHVISPNVYRTLDEAYETFEWFANIGEWKQNFPSWEVKLMVNIGAVAMWLISKRLKQKHQLKEDVRISLYDECRKWTRSLGEKGSKFMGGNEPDLSDITVYGILSSMEGCAAFQDVLQNTNIGEWFNRMKKTIISNSGTIKNNI